LSITELLAAINRSDFQSSSNILQKFLPNGRMGKNRRLAKTLQFAFREKRNLRIRDHIAHFLDIEPVYCALEIPSYELLDVVKGSGDRSEAAQRMFELARDLVDSQSPKFNSGAVTIEKTASSVYSVFLPNILKNRILEITNCRVPYTTKGTHKSGRTLYYIGQLLDTRYGKSILNTFPKSDVQSVVGEELWSQIASALSNLGFEPESMYEEILPNDWYHYVKSLDREISRTPQYFGRKPTDEIDAIRRLESAIQVLEMDGINDFIRSRLLREIADLRTHHFNKELIQQLPKLASNHKESVISILIDTLDPAAEMLLNSYLESRDPRIRKFAARGLARLNAIKSPLTVSDPSNADSIEVAELMIPSTRRERLRRRANSELLLLARSKIPGVRKDIARILVELHDRNNSEILIQLVADPNKEVAIEILSHIERLPPPLAKEILKAAFSSSHTEIVTKAEEIATDLGGLE
jgi:hypothetical protein